MRSSALALFAIVIIAILVGGASYVVIQNNQDNLIRAYQMRLDLESALTLVVDQETGIRGFTSTRERLFLQPYIVGQPAFEDTLQRLRRDAAISGLDSALPMLARLDALHGRWVAEVAVPLMEPSKRRKAGTYQVLGKVLTDRMRARIAQVQGVIDQEIAHTRGVSATTFVVAISTIVFFVVLLGAVALFSEQQNADRERAMREQIAERNHALERSNTSLYEFAYVASHDLQEPLRTVASFTQLLQKRYADKLDTTANEFIDFAVDGAQRMQQLIADILAYSRVTTHGKPLQRVELQTCVEHALQNLHVAIAERSATVEVGPMPAVSGDDVQLDQLFQNLIGNALKYCTNAVPHVEIGARRQGAMWAISVADNGIGIAAEYHEKIFRIFQRLHTRNEYSGTGIGLAVVNGIVDRHGGQIWVESEEGKGSTFSFTLRPASEGEEAA